MPDTRTLPFRERLALNLSDLAVAGDITAADAGAPPIDVTIRTHFVGMDELPPPPDDPLRRRDDPMAGLYRQFMAGPRTDFEKVEPVLLKWLRASPERAEEFAEDPAAVIRKLPRVKPEVKARLARYFGQPVSRAVPRLAGIKVTEMTFDAKPADPRPIAAAEIKTGETINADALFQVGFSHLVRIFAEKMLPAIRQAASQIPFLFGTATGTVRLLVEQPGDPQLAIESDGALKMTLNFAITQLEIPPLNPGQLGTNVDLGAVKLEARLNLSTIDLVGGVRVDLALAMDGLTISQPARLTAALTPAWDAASAKIVDILEPLFAFSVPMQFPAGLCDIAPRKLKAGLLPKGAAGTQESLALAIALLDSTDASTLDPGPTSRVKDGQDGAIFLSNHLMVEVACCLLTQSSEFGALPAPDHQASEAEPWCRWENVPNFRLGQEVFDSLVYFQISAVNGGISTELQLKKSGFGWSVTVTITADTQLNLVDGVMSVRAVPQVVIEKEVEWWAKLLAILAIIGGAVLIVVGIVKGGNVPLIILGASLMEFGLVLGAVVIVLGALLGALTPSQLADADQLIGLLPTGITDKLGKLSFLTALDWDDLEFGGYMTLPGSPSLVAGGDEILQPGSAIDLDTGEIVIGADLGARMDADLRLHEAPGLAVARELAPAPPQSSPPSGGGGSAPSAMVFARVPGIDFGGVVGLLRGRKVEAIGASRLVLFGARPYASIGYSDLVQLGFPQTATAIGVPGVPPPGADPVVKTFAVRTSAGQLASCAVWTDHLRRTNLRYRTFDTPVWLSIDPNISIQTFGKPGVTDLTMIMNGTFTAVPGPQWPTQPPTSYRWYWSGVELLGSGLLDSIGNSFTVIGGRCQIETVHGADLKGWLCAAASNASGLEAVACRNIHHIGRIPKLPDIPDGGFGGPGGPGGGFGGGLPGGGGPHL